MNRRFQFTFNIKQIFFIRLQATFAGDNVEVIVGDDDKTQNEYSEKILLENQFVIQVYEESWLNSFNNNQVNNN